MKRICLHIFWAISGGAFTFLCMLRGSYYELLVCILASMILCGYYIPKYKTALLKNLEQMKWFIKVLCFFAAITIAYYNITLCYKSENIYYLLTKINMGRFYLVLLIFLSILSIPIFFLYVLYGFHLIEDSIRKIYAKYKKFFFFAGINSVLVIMVYSFSQNLFFKGYNALYSMDSSRYIETNVFINFTAGENDIRQPFFGIASSLLYALPNFISSFIPGIYPYFIGITNVFLIVIGIILLIDMMELDEKNRGIAFAFYMVLYPVILFFFAIEQYASTFFFTMMFLHQIYSGKRNTFLYALNGGALSVSFVWLPLMGIDKKNKNYDLKKCVLAVFSTIGIAVVFGRFSLFFHSIDSVRELLRYSGKDAGLLMTEQLHQYFNFVANCFIKTDTDVTKVEGIMRYVLSGEGNYWVAGILIFFLCIVSFFINRKKYVCRISMYWLFIGFIVMAMIGWGTAENNLVLYSLYFGWPFAVLIFELVNKGLQIPIVRICALMCVICIGFYNIYGFTDILRFGRIFL